MSGCTANRFSALSPSVPIALAVRRFLWQRGRGKHDLRKGHKPTSKISKRIGSPSGFIVHSPVAWRNKTESICWLYAFRRTPSPRGRWCRRGTRRRRWRHRHCDRRGEEPGPAVTVQRGAAQFAPCALQRPPLGWAVRRGRDSGSGPEALRCAGPGFRRHQSPAHCVRTERHASAGDPFLTRALRTEGQPTLVPPRPGDFWLYMALLSAPGAPP